MVRDAKHEQEPLNLDRILRVDPPGSFHANKAGDYVIATSKPLLTTLKQERGDIVQSDRSSPTPYYAWRYTAVAKACDMYANRYWHWNHYDQNRAHGTWTNEASPGITNCYVGNNFHFPEQLDIAATNKLMDAINDSPVDMGQFLGELPEARRHILNSAVGVLSAYRSVRNGNYALAAKHLGLRGSQIPKSAAGHWLSWKFGWQPILNDIFGMADVAQNGIDQLQQKRHSVRRTVSMSHNSHLGIHVKDNVVKGVTAGVTYEIDSPWTHGLNSLGLLNPVAIAWELVPLSFVFDWFVPVGSFLRAFTAPLGLRFLHGYKTRWVRGNATVSYYNNWLQTYPFGEHPQVEYTVKGMSRIVLGSFPKPRLIIRPELDAGKLNTFLSLLAARGRDI